MRGWRAATVGLVFAAIAVAVLGAGIPANSYRAWKVIKRWRPKIDNHRTQSYIPVVTADNNETPFTFERASAPLTTPTSNSDNDCVHPDSLYVSGGFGGHNWWMVMSPFFGASITLENPEILYSDDGTTWTAIAGNPIDDSPTAGTDFNSDPCLMYDDGTLYCYYREMLKTEDAYDGRIMCRTSTDGETWSAETTVIGPIVNTTEGIMSPIVRNVNGTYYLWTVDNVASPREINLRTSSSPTSDFSSGTTCTITTDAGEDIWHIHMIWDGDAFYGLWTNSSVLLFARSYDGENWDVNGVPVFGGGGGAAWDEAVYQTALVRRPGYNYFDVFYSAIEDPGGTPLHRIGRGKLHWAAGDDGDLYGNTETSGATFVSVMNSRLRIDDTSGAAVNITSRTASTGASFDPRFHFQHGSTPASKTTMGWDASASVFAIAPSALGTNNGLEIDASGNTTIPTGLIIPQGTTPGPATKGALFYDTDAGGADGSLMMYTGAGWETVKDFN